MKKSANVQIEFLFLLRYRVAKLHPLHRDLYPLIKQISPTTEQLSDQAG